MAESTNISPPQTAAGSGCGCETTATQKESQDAQAPVQSQAKAVRDKAAQTGERARQTARETTETVQAKAQEFAGRAKEQMDEAAGKARAQGQNLLNSQKDKAASELHAYSDATRRAASRLEEEDDANLARFLRSAADRMESLGSHLRDRSLGELVDEVEDMARRRPEVFFGAMFVAGLAAARFAKASRRRRIQDRIETAASRQPPAESPYFQTQPVAAPGPIYPQPPTVALPTGSTPSQAPGTNITPTGQTKHHG